MNPSTVQSTRRPEQIQPQTVRGRVAVLAKPRQVHVENRSFAPPGPGQVRVRLHGCGVCASNLPVWEGRPWFSYPHEPGAPGHEGWGTVEAVGPGVSQWQVGERVALLSYHAFAEYDLAAQEQVVRIPAAIGDRPFPGEPLACAINIFERAAIQAGDAVAIVGAGFLGLLLTRLAVRCGAQVLVLSRRPFSLQMARQSGAHQALASEPLAAAVEQVHQLTGGRGCCRVIETGGKQATLDLASALVAERGRLIVAGYHQDGTRQVDMQSWNWRGIDVINAHERDPAIYVRGMRAAAQLVADYPEWTEGLLTHTYSLDQLGQALQTAVERPEGFVKALVTMPCE